MIIDEFLRIDEGKPKYYFPKSLNKENIILSYIESDLVNLNYLALILKSLGSNELVLSDKTRLYAKRKYEQKSKELLMTSSSISYGVEVSFSDTQQKLVDIQIRFTHVHDINRMSVLTKAIQLQGKKEYLVDIGFKQLNNLAQLQMIIYYHFLKNENLNLENICKWFFEEYLAKEFLITGFYFNSPSQDSTFLEKIRTINSEIDSVLKQFSIWCNEGNIDQELMQISSSHIVYNSIPSLIDKKYIYPKAEEFNIASNLLCSDQSRIRYISKEFNDKKFHILITKNNLRIADFNDHQKSEINWLVEHNYIFENDEGFLKNDEDLIWIIDELYFNEVLSYHNLTKKIQVKIDILIDKRYLKTENTLFSKLESDYLNYMLNKSDFTNGLDLRNKYIHGTQILDPKKQENNLC